MKYKDCLTDDLALQRLIEEAERDLQTPSRDVAADVMRAIREKERKEKNTLRRIYACACFASAACLALMSGFGVFSDVLRILSAPANGFTELVKVIFK